MVKIKKIIQSQKSAVQTGDFCWSSTNLCECLDVSTDQNQKIIQSKKSMVQTMNENDYICKRTARLTKLVSGQSCQNII